MVRDLRQEEVKENAAKAPGILPREVKEAWDQAEAEVVAEARVEAEAP